MAAEAEYNQRQQQEEREWQRRERDAFRAFASRNLDVEFMEVAGHRVFTIPYANVYALANELPAIENPTDDQQRLKVILDSTTLQMQATRGHLLLPTLLMG